MAGVDFIHDDAIDMEWVDTSKVDLTNKNECFSYLY